MVKTENSKLTGSTGNIIAEAPGAPNPILRIGEVMELLTDNALITVLELAANVPAYAMPGAEVAGIWGITLKPPDTTRPAYDAAWIVVMLVAFTELQVAVPAPALLI
jgi:hypothetical protein